MPICQMVLIATQNPLTFFDGGGSGIFDTIVVYGV